MTEQELISKLQELKQIKPRKDWVVLAKMNILESSAITPKKVVKPVSHWNFSNVFELFYQKKFAYALAALLFVFVGALGVLKYIEPQGASVVQLAQKSQATVLAETTLKSNVEEFKVKSQNLTQAVQGKSQNASLVIAIKEAKDATKNLTDTITKNPQLAKTVALEVNNNRTLLDIPGGNSVPGADELQNSTDALEKVIDSQEIADLEKTTLTKDQQMTLASIKDFYDKGNYSAALVNILLLQKSVGNSTDNTNSTSAK